MKRLGILLLTIALCVPAHARSRQVIREFRKLNPCPSTGKTTGPCSTHRVDHRVPLCAGGVDGMPNLQWQEKQESYRKDVDERRLCQWLRR